MSLKYNNVTIYCPTHQVTAGLSSAPSCRDPYAAAGNILPSYLPSAFLFLLMIFVMEVLELVGRSPQI